MLLANVQNKNLIQHRKFFSVHKSSVEGRVVDALALKADEGRDILR